jgi:hypothetical protein
MVLLSDAINAPDQTTCTRVVETLFVFVSRFATLLTILLNLRHRNNDKRGRIKALIM